MPEAKTTLPEVYSYACFAVHSAFEVGLESAKTMGRLLFFAISWRTGFEKAFGTAAAPTNAVGLQS